MTGPGPLMIRQGDELTKEAFLNLQRQVVAGGKDGAAVDNLDGRLGGIRPPLAVVAVRIRFLLLVVT